MRETCDAGVAHIAEDRQLRGLVLDFTLAENLALREYRSAADQTRRLAVDRPQMAARARRLLDEYDVAAATPARWPPSLSGGNQQKVCIAREIAANPRLLMAHQPTRGLDVGAIEFVHRRLRGRARRGPGDPAGVARVSTRCARWPTASS